jgi:hypothetical protein
LRDGLALAKAAALNQMLSGRGWQVAAEIAASLVKDAEDNALSCSDDSKVLGLQKEAKASREFWKKFQNRIAETAAFETTSDFDSISGI